LVLGVSLNVTRGYFSREVRENYERARALCENVGHARQLFAIVHAVWYAQLGGAEADGARRSVEDLARIAASLDTVEFGLRADLARGLTESWNGNFAAAVRILTKFLADLRNQAAGIHLGTYGGDVAVTAFMQGGLALWFLGCPDQARAYARCGLSRAEKSGQPFDRASALFKSAFLELLCGDAAAAADLASRAATVCADNTVPFFLPYCRFLRGAALVQQEDVSEGLAEMLQSLAEQRAASGSFFCDVILAHVATACGRAGRWDEGLRHVDEGIELVEIKLERLYAAELWRVKGELLLEGAEASRGRKRAAASRMVDAAQQCFRRALEIARKQEAGSFALRSASSLARLSMKYDRADDARELLRSIYASFTEGFDTNDLKDAKALLSVRGN
jgi:adenylate cyclase